MTVYEMVVVGDDGFDDLDGTSFIETLVARAVDCDPDSSHPERLSSTASHPILVVAHPRDVIPRAAGSSLFLLDGEV